MAKQTSGSLHLTKKVDYGLLLLAILSKQEKKERVSINEVAKENNIPHSFLQKIANQLQKDGLVKTERGKYGGSSLAKPANKITIKAVIESLDGPIAITACSCTKTAPCKRAKICEIKTGLQNFNKEIEKFFLSKTLDKFIS
jgi:Rrf2 family protein